MASKKYIELQEYSNDDLLAELNSRTDEYNGLTFDHSVRGLDNPLVLREMRRDIARLKTEARRRELSEASPEELMNRSRIRMRRRKK